MNKVLSVNFFGITSLSFRALSIKALQVSSIAFAAALSIASANAQEVETSDEIERVRAELLKMIPPAATADIIATEASNVYRVEFHGSFASVYTVGDHVLIGELLNTKDKVNVGEVAQSERTAKVIADVPTDKMIVFGPKDAKRHITVFTDIDCGYCRKLHNEVDDLTSAGIQVRYLAFPRAGVGSNSYNKYVSVWCNDNPQTALTTAKSGGDVPTATCENPISETYNLGQQVGVRGTPTIVFDDGTLTPGYLPSAELIRRMGINAEEPDAS